MKRNKVKPNVIMREVEQEKFDAIRIALASPEKIKSWSFGEVRNTETINYRTLKPERDGLFCERIFGPVKDYECNCGALRFSKNKGRICEKCGVEITTSKVRRDRMGHIELAIPVAHIWFYKGTPSYIATMVEITSRELVDILYYIRYIVLDRGNTVLIDKKYTKTQPLEKKQLLTEQEFRQYTEGSVLQYELPAGITPCTSSGSAIKFGETIGQFISKYDGKVKSIKNVIDESQRRMWEVVIKNKKGSADKEKPEEAESVYYIPKRVKSFIEGDEINPVAVKIIRMVSEGQEIEKGQVLAELKNVSRFKEFADGYVELNDFSDILEFQIVRGKAYKLNNDADIKVKNWSKVNVGDKLFENKDGVTTSPVCGQVEIETIKTETEDINEETGEVIHITDSRYILRVRECYEFEAAMGSEAIKTLLKEIDVDKEASEIREQLSKPVSEQARRKLVKRLKILEAFSESADYNKPEWMILDIIPVIPPDLRPLVPLDGGRYASSDLNDLYRRVINRNNRLKRMRSMKVPEVILRQEKRGLQEAVDRLLDNSKSARRSIGSNKQPLKSLADMLKGKKGRFRQNLLGKRVDYSARSVIVVGPELKLHQCGLPKKIALELFKPFIIHKLEERRHGHSKSKKMVENPTEEVWAVLEEIVQDHPILLNRAPTLHRLGIQAFMPVLIDGTAIQLHPLTCTAFNADFDGDQMAVHLPLSYEAQLEAKMLMLASNNILVPGSGLPVTVPSQDMVLGLSYLTRGKIGARGEDNLYSSEDEVIYAYNTDKIDLHARIQVMISKGTINELVDTTVGRVIFNEIVPEKLGYINEELVKKSIGKLVNRCYVELGNDVTAEFVDDLKDLGYKYSTIAGMSISIDDMVIPKKKYEIVAAAQKQIVEINDQYQSGRITEGERSNKVIDLWTHVTDRVSEELFSELEKTVVTAADEFNPIFFMQSSGARGSKAQIRQLAAMRGLMAKPSGEIMETPIVSNFREGLTVLEYFISTHGARKGLADTALKTAESGYLTRRLVDVSQDVIINEEDCGTLNGIEVRAIEEGVEVIESFGERILGRITLEDVKIPGLGNVIVKAGQMIDEDAVEIIEQAGINKLKIRSVLTCQSKKGICQKCYGRDLGTGKLVRMGTAIGIIASESIGEPGTQLTMRTFHIGGTASREDNFIKALFTGVVKQIPFVSKQSKEEALIIKEDYIYGHRIQTLSMSSDNIHYIDSNEKVIFSRNIDKNVKQIIRCKESKDVSRRIKDPLVELVLESDIDGTIMLEGKSTLLVKRGKTKEKYEIPKYMNIVVSENQQVKKGDVLAERVIITQMSGTVSIEKENDNTIITIKSRNVEPISARISKGTYFKSKLELGTLVYYKEKDIVKRGQNIAEIPQYKPILADFYSDNPDATGKVKFININIQEEVDPETGKSEKKVVRFAKKQISLKEESQPQIMIEGDIEQYEIPKNMTFLLENLTGKKKINFKISKGDIIACYTKTINSKAKELVGKISVDNLYSATKKVTKEEFLKLINSTSVIVAAKSIKGKINTHLPKKSNKREEKLVPYSVNENEIIDRDFIPNVPKKQIGNKFLAIKELIYSSYSNINNKIEISDDSAKKIEKLYKGKLRVLKDDKDIIIAKNSGICTITKNKSGGLDVTIQPVYRIPYDAYLAVEEGQKIGKYYILARMVKGSMKTKDITGGLPRVDELFEARQRPQESAILSEIGGIVRFEEVNKSVGVSRKKVQKVRVIDEINNTEKVYLIPIGKHLAVHEGDYIEKGERLTTGPIAPHDILRIKGEKELQKFLVNEVQEVYRVQGVTINDKHIEVIVRQMLKNMIIIDPGDSDYIYRQIVSKQEFDAVTEKLIKSGKRPPRGTVLLQGIKKSALTTESFISAASFQETTRILSEAAVFGKVDTLNGLKENVILGRLIPAGTGHKDSQNSELVFEEDAMNIAKDEPEATQVSLDDIF